MNRIVFLLALGIGAAISAPAATNAAPDFNEVRALIRANLPGVSDAELDRAAVEGLVSGLHGRVALPQSEFAQPVESNAPVITKTSMLDDGVAYVRVGRVGEDLARALGRALQQSSVSNKLKGLALDLRYAGGDDYGAVAASAELFQAKPKPLLDWTGKMVEAKGGKDAFKFPVAVLVNSETTGGAEALAAVLRQTGAGLVLGSQTAGRAMVMRDFTLKSGQKVQIASATVKLGDGSVLSGEGVRPDIAVTVKPQEERAYFADASANLTGTNAPAEASLTATNLAGGTNRPARKRMSEAELVRKHREGGGDEDELPLTTEAEPDQPVLRDPVLVRAVDLLKGLAVVRQSRAE